MSAPRPVSFPDTGNADRCSTMVEKSEIQQLHGWHCNEKGKKIKTMFRRYQFTVSSSFQFVESCLFLERMVCSKDCKHFLPSQNTLPKAAVSCLLKLLSLSRASEVKESEFIITFVSLFFVVLVF